MRILYIDIDTLRPDHLGCYGYHRATSPNIDALAQQATVFENVHASDVPCLPSRTALLTGKFGIHNGVVNHGGTDADPVIDGADREFWSRLHIESLATQMKSGGVPFHMANDAMRMVSVSSFAQRHSAFHWYAGFDEAYNVGKFGLETADEVHAIAADWLQRNGREENWFLHVHMWDPHTPYRAPSEMGEPFADDALPAWYTEEVRQQHWALCGPHSARECYGFAPNPQMSQRFPRQPQEAADMAGARKMFDGYDCGVLMADDYVGRLLNLLADLDIDDDTAVMLSSDHGENLGELNVYGDHQTADQATTHIPMILKWPGVATGGRMSAKHYQIDVTATLLELLGRKVPENWDGVSFAQSLKSGLDEGRESLILSQAAWACQRGVRLGDWLYLSTRHDAYHLWDEEMLFDVASDPHQQFNRADSEPDQLQICRDQLAGWHADMMVTAARGRDPHDNVMAEGGPYHIRRKLPEYLERLRNTERSALADQLAEKYAALI